MRVHRSEAKTLDLAPALRKLAAEKWQGSDFCSYVHVTIQQPFSVSHSLQRPCRRYQSCHTATELVDVLCYHRLRIATAGCSTAPFPGVTCQSTPDAVGGAGSEPVRNRTVTTKLRNHQQRYPYRSCENLRDQQAIFSQAPARFAVK